MDIYHSMVPAQQVEDTRLKRKNIQGKRAKSYERGTSKGRLEFQDKPMYKKWFSNKVPSNIPEAYKDRVSNTMWKKGRSGNSRSDKPTSAKYGRKRRGECFVGTGNYYGMENMAIRLEIFLM